MNRNNHSKKLGKTASVEGPERAGIIKQMKQMSYCCMGMHFLSFWPRERQYYLWRMAFEQDGASDRALSAVS